MIRNVRNRVAMSSVKAIRVLPPNVIVVVDPTEIVETQVTGQGRG